MSKKISIALIVFLVIFVALWLWSALTPNKSVIIGGSTSANALMQNLTSKYKKDKDVEFIYNSTGSGAGIEGVQNNIYSAGVISKTLEPNLLDSNSKFDPDAKTSEWSPSQSAADLDTLKQDLEATDKRYYYAFQIAIEAIIFIYNKPIGWVDDLDPYMNFYMIGDQPSSINGIKPLSAQDILEKVYNGTYSWYDLGQEFKKTNAENWTSVQDGWISNLPASPILAVSREDGSGTRDAFRDKTGVQNVNASNVSASNGQVLSQVESSEGSFGYVSLAFLESAVESGLKIASINGVNLEVTPNGENPIELIEQGSYSFQRPFIAIYKGDNGNHVRLINFFEWILNQVSDNFDLDDDDTTNAYESEGLVPYFKLNPQGGP